MLLFCPEGVVESKTASTCIGRSANVRVKQWPRLVGSTLANPSSISKLSGQDWLQDHVRQPRAQHSGRPQAWVNAPAAAILKFWIFTLDSCFEKLFDGKVEHVLKQKKYALRVPPSMAPHLHRVFMLPCEHRIQGFKWIYDVWEFSESK